MTPVRESLVLPFVFLTVALAGGLRVSLGTNAARLEPPPLISLVLALLLLAVLVRGRRLAPARLMGSHRSALENLTGFSVVASLFAATAQIFNAVTPDAGLLHVIFNTFFVLLLWNTLAAGPAAGRLLHSLLVVFGSAFVLKHVVLASLYAPAGSLAKRFVTAMLEGVTLGTLDYAPQAAVAGYVAFGAIVLYMVGIVLLPGAGPPAILPPPVAARTPALEP